MKTFLVLIVSLYSSIAFSQNIADVDSNKRAIVTDNGDFEVTLFRCGAGFSSTILVGDQVDMHKARKPYRFGPYGETQYSPLGTVKFTLASKRSGSEIYVDTCMQVKATSVNQSKKPSPIVVQMEMALIPMAATATRFQLSDLELSCDGLNGEKVVSEVTLHSAKLDSAGLFIKLDSSAKTCQLRYSFKEESDRLRMTPVDEISAALVLFTDTAFSK